MPRGRAAKRYNRTVLSLSLLYAGLLFTVTALASHHVLHGALGYGAAILPALPIIGIFVAMGRYLIEEQDEYVRLLATRQALIATGSTLSVTTGWGFLESFAMAPHIAAYWAAILWFVGLGFGAAATRIDMDWSASAAAGAMTR